MLLFLLACNSEPPAPPPAAKPPEPKPAEAKPAEPKPAAGAGMVITKAADVVWSPIMADKPDFGQVTVLQGNPKEGASSMMMRFPAGGVAGLHSHTSAYTAIVLSGSPVHGASEKDAKTFNVGDVWHQPGGEIHYDGCAKESTAPCVTLIRWEGAQDYAPAQAPSEKTAWTSTLAADIAWKAMTEGGPSIAPLVGNPAEGASTLLMKFPSGFKSGEHIHTAGYTAVVVSGACKHGSGDAMTDVGPGSTWTQPGGQPHSDMCVDEKGCVVAITYDGAMDFKPVGAPAGAPAPGAPAPGAPAPGAPAPAPGATK